MTVVDRDAGARHEPRSTEPQPTPSHERERPMRRHEYSAGTARWAKIRAARRPHRTTSRPFQERNTPLRSKLRKSLKGGVSTRINTLLI